MRNQSVKPKVCSKQKVIFAIVSEFSTECTNEMDTPSDRDDIGLEVMRFKPSLHRTNFGPTLNSRKARDSDIHAVIIVVVRVFHVIKILDARDECCPLPPVHLKVIKDAARLEHIRDNSR